MAVLVQRSLSLPNFAPISQKLPPLLFKVGNCHSAKAITQFVTQRYVAGSVISPDF